MKTEKKNVLLTGKELADITFIDPETPAAAAFAFRDAVAAVKAVHDARREFEEAMEDALRLSEEGEKCAVSLDSEVEEVKAYTDEKRQEYVTAEAGLCDMLKLRQFHDKDRYGAYFSGEKRLDEEVNYFAFGPQVYKPNVTPEQVARYKPFRFRPPVTRSDKASDCPFVAAAARLAVARAAYEKAISNVVGACETLSQGVARLDISREAERRTTAEAVAKREKRLADEVKKARLAKAAIDAKIAALENEE